METSMAECCANCQYRLKLEKYDYTGNGCKHTDMDGYVCTGFAYEGLAVNMVGCEPEIAHCEMFTPRDKEPRVLSLEEIPMRPIDADALREVIENHVTTVSVCPTADWSRGKTEFKKQVLEDIDNAPTIDAEPQKFCYPCLDFDGRDVWLCSNCEKVLFHPAGDQSDEDTKNYIRYCHFCGRKVKWDD